MLREKRLCQMGKIEDDIYIRLVNEIDLYNNSKEINELLEDNYVINFPKQKNFSEFVDLNFNDLKKYQKDGTAIIIGAYLNQKIIGILWAYRRKFLGEERLHISHIIVNSTFRGYGIGSRMIYYLEKYALKKGIIIIELLTSSENTNTIQFYNKNGFKITRIQFEKNLGDNGDNP